MKEKSLNAQERKYESFKEINLALILVNTSAFIEMKSRKRISDKTIPIVKRLLKDNLSISLSLTEIIPDSENHINETLVELMKNSKINSIIFCGGTGISPQDVTYETIEPHLEQVIDGFGEIFRHLSYNEIGTPAILYRAVAGILKSKKGKKVIFLIPNNPKAVRIALKYLIIPELENILYLINKEE